MPILYFIEILSLRANFQTVGSCFVWHIIFYACCGLIFTRAILYLVLMIVYFW